MASAERAELTVALGQMHCGRSADDNVARAVSFVSEAAKRGAQLVCLPELFRTGYFCQEENPELFDLAEPVPGPTTDALCRAAASQHIAVIGSVFERRAPGLYHNTAVVIERDGSLRGVYRKMHIPHDPLYFEKYYFTPGDLGVRVFALHCGQIAVLICWDQWYPEAARLAALAGAQIIFYPTAIGWHPTEKEAFGADQYAAWQTIQRAHAIANGVFVAACNHTGMEGQIEFWGGSFVADPFGRILAQAKHDAEELLLVRCNLSEIEHTRRHWPFLRDRRVDAYADLSRRYLDPAR